MSGLSFKKLNGGAKKSEVKYMKLAEGDNTFRIAPDSVLPGYTYWVKGKNGKDFPFDALQFDRENERFDNKLPCPIRDLEIKDKKGDDLRCQWSYKCQVINKATGQVEILQLKKGMLSEIISVAQDLEVDPTDLDTGMWLTVTRTKTGPLAYNVEYKLRQLKCKPSALSDEEKELFAKAKTITELFKPETYDEQLARLNKHINGEQDEESNASDDQEAIDELS